MYFNIRILRDVEDCLPAGSPPVSCSVITTNKPHTVEVRLSVVVRGKVIGRSRYITANDYSTVTNELYEFKKEFADQYKQVLPRDRIRGSERIGSGHPWSCNCFTCSRMQEIDIDKG